MSKLSRSEGPAFLKKITADKGELRQTSVEVTKIDPLDVGGQEGGKGIVHFSLSSPTVDGSSEGKRRDLQLFLKEHHKHRTPKYMREIAAYYDKLRRLGYPVPNTVRLIEEDGKYYLAMTDITEGGRYQVWGWSDDMTDEQYRELRDMRLVREDREEIARQVIALCERAALDGVELHSPYFHIRKEKNSGEIDIMLLDLQRPTSVDSIKKRLREWNLVAGESFVHTRLVEALKIAQRLPRV